MESLILTERPACQACGKEKSAIVLFSGRWVCGECAIRKTDEINKMVWG